MSLKNGDAKPKRPKKHPAKKTQWRWVLSIFLATIVISGFFSFLSNQILNTVAIWAAFLTLLAIVMIGIVFDIIGVAVTAADPKPFHGMAARKLKGAAEAIALLRNANKVSSFCNDVIGDICGVISGSAAAVIAAEALRSLPESWEHLLPLVLSALVAALTVGGKAIGKTFAMRESTQIVFLTAKAVRAVQDIPKRLKAPFRKKKQ